MAPPRMTDERLREIWSNFKNFNVAYVGGADHGKCAETDMEDLLAEVRRECAWGTKKTGFWPECSDSGEGHFIPASEPPDFIFCPYCGGRIVKKDAK